MRWSRVRAPPDSPSNRDGTFAKFAYSARDRLISFAEAAIKLPSRKSVYFGVFGALILWCLYGAVTSYIAHARMRTIPVEVVASALTIDEWEYDSEYDPALGFTLTLDLRTTDGSARSIHTELFLSRAAHPEEAFDELAKWAPKSTHNVYQLRGDARAIRLPGGNDFQERTAGNGYLFGAILLAVIAFVVHAAFSDLQRIPVGPILLGSSALFWCLIIGFLWSTVPRIFSGPNATASITVAPETYPDESLPPQVTVTPAGRARLDIYKAIPRHILTFNWNGRTIHGGLGLQRDAYSMIAAECPATASTCDFDISPTDRWDVQPRAGWNAAFFAPLFLLLVFGIGLTCMGLYFNRQPSGYHH